MENQAFFGEPSSQAKPEALPFDFKRVFYRALRYWYVIVISLSIALTWAYLNNRWSTSVYPISASIIIRESQETGGAELLYNNALINQYRNYLNEPYIIRSFPLIESVVRDLNYDISFFREGRLLTSDASDIIPVTANIDRTKRVYVGSAIFTIVSPTEFTLQPLGEHPKVDKFRFGDSVVYQGNHLLFTLHKDVEQNFERIPWQMRVANSRSVAATYVGKLGVNWAEQGAGVINLTLSGSNISREIGFLEGLIHRYQMNDLNKKNQKAVSTIDFISKEINSLSDSMHVVEGRLQAFKNIGQAADLGDKVDRLLERFESFDKEKAEYMVKESYYDYLTKYLHSPNGLDQIIVPSSMGISDGVITDLVLRLERMQFDIKLGNQLNKEGNAILADKQLRVNQIRKDIDEALLTMRATDKIRMDLINRQIKAIESQLSEFPSTERQYVSIKRNYNLMENLYIFLMQKLSEAKISRASNSTDILVVNAPSAGGPISPKPKQNYSIALILGLLIPFVLFGIAEFFNDKIQSKEDIDKISTIPFIGGIGHNKSDNNLIVQDKPKSSIAESFRALRSNLNYFTSNQDKKVFLVSSSISGEGKTFTTLNLATVLAMSGKKTMIIGADMRKPKLYGDFGLHNEKGLSNYLSGLSTLEEVIQTTNYSNLYLISGGPVPPNPSELLMTKRMNELMKDLTDQFDYVVIDTPPIALVTDAFVLAKYADHSIFLIRQNFTPKTLLKNVEEFYRTGRLKNISVLLNDIYKTGPGYGYEYHYGYGYGYGNKKKNAAYYDEGGKK